MIEKIWSESESCGSLFLRLFLQSAKKKNPAKMYPIVEILMVEIDCVRVKRNAGYSSSDLVGEVAIVTE